MFVDDATSRLMHLRLVRTESTFAYFSALRGYLEEHGKPVDAARGDGLTQFGRALHQLNIELICANSSQAKGRVERAHKTLQDRLVKELRLARINTADTANRAMPAFVADYNARFSRAPADVLRHKGVALPYRVFEKDRRVTQAAIVENKFFGPLLEQIRDQQLQRDAAKKPRRGIRPSREIEAR